MAAPTLVDERTKILLRAIPYFEALDDDALRAIAREVVIREYRAGELVFLEGETDAGLHLVTKGLCKIYRLSEGGREHVLSMLRPGDSCNEVPVVDGGPNPATMAVIEDTTVWVISRESLQRLRQRYPSLNDEIIKNLAKRCRQLVQRIYNLSFLPVTGRLAAFLLQQSEDSELSRRQWTQEEIAAHLGTVREMVGRAMKELQDARLITLDRHRIEIVDRAGLAELT